ncbi:hypothetical protein ACQR35_10955 [Pseudarthrobacter sp. J1738]|uniref:hypothetical protein n=1 Tax=Pseudarthrobacter sp. J1738 TaxID=3420446 RepID=UPI003D2949CC
MSRHVQEDSRAWWKQRARQKDFVIKAMDYRIKQLEADYDLIESELRDRVETCTCMKDVN